RVPSQLVLSVKPIEGTTLRLNAPAGQDGIAGADGLSVFGSCASACSGRRSCGTDVSIRAASASRRMISATVSVMPGAPVHGTPVNVSFGARLGGTVEADCGGCADAR